MNELLDSLFALERNRRLAVYGAVAAALVGLFWFFSFSGLSAELSEKTAEVEQLRLDHERKLKRVERLEEYQAEVRELDARLQRAVAQLPDQKEIPDLLSTISGVGRDSGLEILVFRARPETYQEFYAEVPVEMVMRGTYRQLTGFLERVGRLDRIVNIVNLSMKKPTVVGDSVILETSCTAVTFRFLTEEERARIAAEKERNKRR